MVRNNCVDQTCVHRAYCDPAGARTRPHKGANAARPQRLRSASLRSQARFRSLLAFPGAIMCMERTSEHLRAYATVAKRLQSLRISSLRAKFNPSPRYCFGSSLKQGRFGRLAVQPRRTGFWRALPRLIRMLGTQVDYVELRVKSPDLLGLRTVARVSVRSNICRTIAGARRFFARRAQAPRGAAWPSALDPVRAYERTTAAREPLPDHRGQRRHGARAGEIRISVWPELGRTRNIGEAVTCRPMPERESGRRAWRTDCACEPFACAYVRPSSLPHSAFPVHGEGDH